MRLKKAVLILLSSLMLFAAAKPCENIGFLPNTLTMTPAMDTWQTEAVDVHTFGRYYTFQIDRDVNQMVEGVNMKIPTTRQATTFQLKAWFDSAQNSHAAMSMKVSLLDGKEVLATQNTGFDSSVSLSLESLPIGKEVTLRYDFFEKQVIH